MALLRQTEGGVAVPELCREHGISSASFYKWRARYGGMDASMMSQMKALEEENRRLKRMFADLGMQPHLLKGAREKSDAASSAPRVGRDGGGDQGDQDRAGLPDVRRQRDMFPLGSPRRADQGAPDMGLWFVLFCICAMSAGMPGTTSGSAGSTASWS